MKTFWKILNFIGQCGIIISIWQGYIHHWTEGSVFYFPHPLIFVAGLILFVVSTFNILNGLRGWMYRAVYNARLIVECLLIVIIYLTFVIDLASGGISLGILIPFELLLWLIINIVANVWLHRNE